MMMVFGMNLFQGLHAMDNCNTHLVFGNHDLGPLIMRYLTGSQDIANFSGVCRLFRKSAKNMLENFPSLSNISLIYNPKWKPSGIISRDLPMKGFLDLSRFGDLDNFIAVTRDPKAFFNVSKDGVYGSKRFFLITTWADLIKNGGKEVHHFKKFLDKGLREEIWIVSRLSSSQDKDEYIYVTSKELRGTSSSLWDCIKDAEGKDVNSERGGREVVGFYLMVALSSMNIQC